MKNRTPDPVPLDIAEPVERAEPAPAASEPPPATPSPAPRPAIRFRRLPREAFHFLDIAVQAIAWLGIIIILYGVISTWTDEVWLPLERFIIPIAASLVLLTTILNALSIYLVPQSPGPASPVSRYITGPAIILLCAVALVTVWSRDLPISVVLGLAILGLSWALLRVLPRQAPQW